MKNIRTGKDLELKNAAIEVMINSFQEQNKPMVGFFWYDFENKNLQGCVFALSSDLNYKYSNIVKKSIKTSSANPILRWQSEQKINKNNFYIGDYMQKPRGRVFEFENEGFKVFVGNWINKYPEAKDIILDVFQLPKNKTEFIIDEHWDIGHGWSQEF